MKRIQLFISLGIIAALIFASIPVTTAKASKPIVFPWYYPPDPFVVIDSEKNCGFPIYEQDFGYWTVSVYFDDQGNPARAIITLPNGSKTWTGPGPAFKTRSLETKGPYMVELAPDGTWLDGKSVGVNVFLVLPGYGPVWGYAGQITGDNVTGMTYKEVGKIVDPPNWDAICAYFKS